MSPSWLPREHGFWVMLTAATLTALVETSFSGAALLTALVVVVAALALARPLSRVVRRQTAAQLGFSLLLGLAGLPISLAGGLGLAGSVATACVWSAVFLAGGLNVRAVFERGRRRQRRALGFDGAAVLVCAAGAGVCFALGVEAHALALALGGLGSAGIALARPTPRRTRAVGLTLTAVVTVVGVALIAGGTLGDGAEREATAAGPSGRAAPMAQGAQDAIA